MSLIIPPLHPLAPYGARPRLLASACLCGIACRYSGTACDCPPLARLYGLGLALAVCPEVEGGLSVPRPACELHNGRAVTAEGKDLTRFFERGARRALSLAVAYALDLAVFKENSPSCGSSRVYDGGFTGRRVPGQGVATALLRAAGIRVVNEQIWQKQGEKVI